MAKNQKSADQGVLKELLSYVVWLVGVFVAVKLITTFIGVVSVVDGDSMEPTLSNGEYLWVDKLDYLISDPERFDVVIFPVEYIGKTKYFVKRIIGLPGETVYIDEEGVIYINGEVLQEGYGKEVIVSYNRQRAAEPVVLGEDEYFVLGDNRNNSSDSRYEVVGNVKRSKLLGRVVVRLWPFTKIGKVE